MAKSDTVTTQKAAAAALDMEPPSLRQWMAKPGFPDCSGGYNLPAIRAYIELARKKSKGEETKANRVHLLIKTQEARIKKADADRKERQEQIEQGNILPRDELTLFQREAIVLARDRLLSLPKELARLVPAKLKATLVREGEKRVRRILDELAGTVQKV